MLAILVSRGNWKTIESDFLGEVGELKACEVETAPECDYEDITETDTLITQRCLNGKYGEELTYENIVNIRSLITEVGDASSYNELLKKKIRRVNNLNTT